MQEPIQIYLSYARADLAEVESLYDHLASQGYKPWMDARNILAGQNREFSIRQAIRTSDFFLVCLTENSVSERGWVQRELGEARFVQDGMLPSDIYLIPVRLSECPIPDHLSEFQPVDLFREGGLERLVQALQAGIARRSEQPASPTRVPGLGPSPPGHGVTQAGSFPASAPPGSTYAQPGSHRRIPPLLPFLPDRGPQVHAIEAALERLHSAPGRLLVCLVHGDNRQCHLKLLEHLKRNVLCKYAGAEQDAAILQYDLKWPDALPDSDAFDQELDHHLAKILLNDGQASRARVNAKLVTHPGPVIVLTSLITQTWMQQGSGALTRYLEFWQAWSEAFPCERLYVFIHVIYQPPPRWVLLWRYKSANAALASFIDGLDRYTSRYLRLLCVPLPRLCNVDQQDAVEWAHQYRTAIEQLCSRDCMDVLHGIYDLYTAWQKKNPTGGIPMRDLAERLRVILGAQTP